MAWTTTTSTYLMSDGAVPNGRENLLLKCLEGSVYELMLDGGDDEIDVEQEV